MKSKIFILLLLVVSFSISMQASGSISKEVPSESFLKKASHTTGVSVSPMAATEKRLSSQTLANTRAWGEPTLPGEGNGGTGGAGNIGGPIGDASLPIVLSILLLYILYRSITSTSKRRSNI